MVERETDVRGNTEGIMEWHIIHLPIEEDTVKVISGFDDWDAAAEYAKEKLEPPFVIVDAESQEDALIRARLKKP